MSTAFDGWSLPDRNGAQCVGRLFSGLVLTILMGWPLASAKEFQKQAVVTQQAHASEIGLEVLRDGGNAIDAAIASAFALAVTHPPAGNIGGGGFLVAYLADRDEVITIDFRERAPRAASARMYLTPEGTLKPGHRAGLRAGGVPGTVRGLGLAHQRFGTGDWEDLVRPAVRLAKDGFPISETLARSLNAQLFDQNDEGRPRRNRRARLADFPASVEAFQRPDGQPWEAGDVLKQPDLAATLRRIAEEGADEFYEGKTADLIVEAMRNQGGLITPEDLESYRAVVRPPVHGTFRGFDVYGMGPPSSGGIVDLLTLNILERYDLRADGPKSPLTLHRITEAMRRAFFVRATELADPDYVEVPTDRLISKSFADALAQSIEATATPSQELAEFPIAGLREGDQTTHLSVIDAQGDAVALTYTLEQSYGSKAVVPGTGFLLNNEMGDFNLRLGHTDVTGAIGTRANRIAPGKRMLSSQSPTLVLNDGQVHIVTGSPGGRTIPNTVLWVLLNILEFDRDPRTAIDAPRTHHGWFPDRLRLEGDDWPESTRNALRDRGHRLQIGGVQGNAQTIVVDPETGTIQGVADRRRDTAKAAGD